MPAEKPALTPLLLGPINRLRIAERDRRILGEDVNIILFLDQVLQDSGRVFAELEHHG